MADGIAVRGPIPADIYGDYMNGRQQKKPSYEPILHPSEYLDYIHCDLGVPYPTTRRGNRFYLGVRDCTTGVYYAEPMRTKSQILIYLKSSFVKRSASLEKSLSIYVPILGENLLIKCLKNTHPKRVLSGSRVHLILRSKTKK